MKIYWGVFRGKEIAEIPNTYCQWLAEHCKDDRIATAADKEMKYRRQFNIVIENEREPKREKKVVGEMKPPIQGMKYRPYGDEVMAGAWLALVIYAVGVEQYTSQFEKETGIDILDVLKSRGINKMIDEATGHTKDAVIKWADWVTKHLWGEECQQK